MATYDHKEAVKPRRRKPSRMLSILFWCGWFAHMGVTCGAQDFLGKDEYLRRVSEGWMDTSPWMWAVIIAVAVLVHEHQRSGVE